jgi:uncharacterized Zn finger protein
MTDTPRTLVGALTPNGRIDVQINRGRVRALVSGTSVYQVEVPTKPLARQKWKVIRSQCAGQLDSMVELLQGLISERLMEVVTRQGEGLFPSPRDISLRCSCPDWATMCKHVAAVLYGVGARLDHEPKMLFTLRGVDPAEMIAAAVTDAPKKRASGGRKRLKTDDVSSVFGIELETSPPKKTATRKVSAKSSANKKKPVTKKPAPKQAKTTK